jgi:hypothetical protein
MSRHLSRYQGFNLFHLLVRNARYERGWMKLAGRPEIRSRLDTVS